MPRTRTARARRTGRGHPGRPVTRHASQPLFEMQRTAGNRAAGRHIEGSGRLPGPVRSHFERAFDTDLSDVRLRTSSEASALDARAMTRGREITFAPGKLDLRSTKGLALLGHELTHVMQQAAGRVSETGRLEGTPLNVSRQLEHQAHTVGERIARGGRADAGLRGHRPRVGRVVQRDVDPANEAKIKGYEKGSEDQRGVFFYGVDEYGKDGETDTYELGLGVYIEHEKYAEMYQARTPLVAQRKVREAAKKRELEGDKSLTKTQRKSRFDTWVTEEKRLERLQAARNVLGKGASDTDVEKLAKAGTGHTWIEFRRSGGGKELGRYTFGFSTLPGVLGGKEGASGAQIGVVKNPDPYAKPEKGKLKRYTVTARKYKQALKKAIAVRQDPPRYKLTGYNCTSFAKKVLEKGGVTFPAEGYPVGPWGAGGTVYSPNDLYDKVEVD